MKAIALLSGGLDSTLAIKVILEQGIEVIAVNFTSPFCQCNRKNGCKNIASNIANNFNIMLKVFLIVDEYFEIIKSPKYGYGKNINPCIDCRILMHRKAFQFMKEFDASFIVTGEVLGQRPMSQHRAALNIIEKESGLKGLILRPLSAKLLPPTIPEEKRWVDRNRLLDICGRSRKPQIKLAEQYNIRDYPCPAGGCLLTDYGFSQRMRDLMNNGGLSLEEVCLLKVGRHFRINAGAKLVVGRDETENNRLESLAKSGDICFIPIEDKGPVGIGRGQFSEEDIFDANRIIARYSDGNKSEVKVGSYKWPDGNMEEVLVSPAKEDELRKLRI